MRVTGGETFARDVQASLLKSDLEQRGICILGEAERAARLCVSLQERETVDAALWKAAEALYDIMQPGHSDREPLSRRPVHERGRYLLWAIQCTGRFRIALEGNYSVSELAQACADYSSHQAQVKAQRSFTAVPGGRLGA